MCVKCIIDGGRLKGAALALAAQTEKNAQADSEAMADPNTSEETREAIRALSEYDCKLAAFIEGRAEYIRLARVGTDAHGKHGIYGGEYEGAYEIDVAHGIKKK